MTIQKVNPIDIKLFASISKQTFLETYADDNSEEDMVKYLADNFSSKQLTTDLSNPNSEFYFVKNDTQIIGYLKLNFGQAQTEDHHDSAMEIERIYALKSYHGKSVGQMLFDKAYEVAKAKKAAYLWLGVWEKNPRAIRFYEKNGFVAFDKHVFVLGKDEQTDLLMKLSL
jgi:hypothetical protein